MDSYHCHFSSHLLRPNWSRELPKPHLLGTLSKRRPLKRKRDPEGDLLCLLLRRPHPFPSGEGRHRAGYDLLCPLPHPSPHTHPHVLLPARGKECEPELCQQLLLSSGHNILWAPVQQLWLSIPTSRGGKQPSADDWEHLRSRPPNPRPLRPAPPCWGNAWGEGGDRGEVEAQALLPLQRHLHVGQRHHPQHHQLRPKDLSTKRSHPDSWDWVYKQFENLPARWAPFYFQYYIIQPPLRWSWSGDWGGHLWGKSSLVENPSNGDESAARKSQPNPHPWYTFHWEGNGEMWRNSFSGNTSVKACHQESWISAVISAVTSPDKKDTSCPLYNIHPTSAETCCTGVGFLKPTFSHANKKRFMLFQWINFVLWIASPIDLAFKPYTGERRSSLHK